jgi:hypothetical protein
VNFRSATIRRERETEELDRFCRDVDLVALACSYGYRIVAASLLEAASGELEAGDGIVLIHRATGDRLVVWRDAAGLWKYSSTVEGVYDRTVVDFLLKRRGLGMGYVRKDLRWWLRETRRKRLRDR